MRRVVLSLVNKSISCSSGYLKVSMISSGELVRYQLGSLYGIWAPENTIDPPSLPPTFPILSFVLNPLRVVDVKPS